MTTASTCRNRRKATGSPHVFDFVAGEMICHSEGGAARASCVLDVWAPTEDSPLPLSYLVRVQGPARTSLCVRGASGRTERAGESTQAYGARGWAGRFLGRR